MATYMAGTLKVSNMIYKNYQAECKKFSLTHENRYVIAEWAVVTMKYLGHFLSVGFGVQGGFSEQGGVLLGGHAQLIVKGVMPDLTEEKERTADVWTEATLD